jgi:hypothetical protein
VPVVDGEYAVNMVGHYNEGMELHTRKMIRDIAPAIESDPSNHVEKDSVLFHFAEQEAHLRCADG